MATLPLERVSLCAADRNHEELPLTDADSHAALVRETGYGSGETNQLSPGTTTLGREADNDIVLDEAAVSRKHAEIITSEAGYYLRDLDSTNGTFVNRQKIGEENHLLNHGDVIRLGGSSTTFVFRHLGARMVKVSIVESPTDAVVVDDRARQVYVHGRRLDPLLTRKEFDLLMLLDSRRGEAISRDDIARNVWPERIEGDVGNHEIEQCVHRVRARIEDDSSKPVYLVTVRGFGYKLN